MTQAEPDLSRLAELAGRIGLHEHLCFIYDTKERQLAAALPFLRTGLERREKCLYIADENSRNVILDALRDDGIEVEHHLRSGTLIVAGKQDTYLEHGRFDPDLWIHFLSQSTRVPGSRFFGVRTILGEMTWALEDDITRDRLIEYEAKLTTFVRDHDIRVLCQYNRKRFSPEIMLGVIRTHPVVVYGDMICKNPYYVPPEEFLKPNQASREVDRLLNNILTWEQSLTQLRALSARLQTVREEERTRAAREIHDELGQALTAIKLEFTALVRDLPVDEGPISRRTQSILKLLDQAIQSVGRIATGLRPPILDELGLVAALEWAAEDFQTRTGTRCQINLPEVEIALDPERATALFRIFQEVLTNIARHANATHVSIRLAQEEGSLVLEVRDNGKGISQEQLSARTSLGILGLRERVLLLGGTLTITGTPGKGTMVRVSIPDSRQAGD